MTPVEVAPATEADIPFVMTTERLDGYDEYVGRWTEPQHRAALRDGRHAYFIARRDGAPIGFTIIRDWASPECVTAIKRIAVAQPGRGHGRAILAHNVDAVFEQTGAFRLWLGVFPDNDRARRAYAAVGFQAEGVARGNALFGGRHRDELVMSILRPEWVERRGRP